MNALADAVNRIAETWWTFAVNVSWQAALVGLAALLLVRFSRRQPAPLRYGLLLIALIKFACPPMLAAPIGLFSRCTPAAWRQAAADATSLAELEKNAFTRPPARLSPHEPVNDAALPPLDPAPTIAEAAARPSAAVVVEPDEIELAPTSARPQLRDLAQRTPSAARSSSRLRLSWKSWLMLLHLTGVLLLAGWTAWQLRLLSRLVRSSCEITDGPRYEQYLMLCQTLKLRRPPRLLESREAVSPMALGLWRPSVLIPAGVLEALPPGDARTVLAHELAHLRRGDVWLNWLRLAVVGFWWFHPVAWLLSRMLRQVNEDCCDDLLLVDGVTNQSDYCDTLLRVAARSRAARRQGSP